MSEPWNPTSDAHDAVRFLLGHMGEDPGREGLHETPRRVVSALREMTSGYRDDPATILACTFDGDGYDQMIVCRGVDFVSLCEHHLLPFVGICDVGYLPGDGRVVGLSKMARLVECFARRFQVQERMTQQIASAMDDHLRPAGVGVIVRASHACMACRGVRKANAEMVTSAMLGAFRDDPSARAEFLAMTGHGT